jgi:hypothetical protein
MSKTGIVIEYFPTILYTIFSVILWARDNFGTIFFLNFFAKSVMLKLLQYVSDTHQQPSLYESEHDEAAVLRFSANKLR